MARTAQSRRAAFTPPLCTSACIVAIVERMLERTTKLKDLPRLNSIQTQSSSSCQDLEQQRLGRREPYHLPEPSDAPVVYITIVSSHSTVNSEQCERCILKSTEVCMVMKYSDCVVFLWWTLPFLLQAHDHQACTGCATCRLGTFH